MSLAGGTGSRKITGQEIMNASKLSVNNTPVINGTSGRIFFQGSTNVLQQSGNLFWDNTNSRLGIGTSIPISPIHILSPIGQQSTITLRTLDNTTSGGYTGINCFDNLDNLAFSFAYGNSGSLLPNSAIIGTRTATGVMSFVTGPSATVRATLFSTGNFAINTTTDAGFRLDVNGTARVSGATTISPNTFNILSTGSTLFFVDNSANNYRVANQISWGGYSPGGFTNNTADIFSVGGNGSSTANGNYFFRLNFNGGNSSGPYGASGNNAAVAQLNAPTAARLYLTAQGGGGVLEGGTSGVLLSTISDGQNLSLRSEKGTGGGGGGINYLSSINGSNHSHRFFHNNVEQMRLQFSGNLLINTTTDAGFRLDVNGTARVSSTTTIGTSAHPFASNLLTLISDQGSASFRIGGGNAVFCTSSISAVNLSSNDFVQCVRVLVGGAARINATTTDWLSVTNWAQSSLGSGNVSANLATFGTAYATINASAQVEIASTTKGFLPPRMTNAQRTAIVSPAVGLIVYCTDVTEGLWVYKSTGWTFIV
jgi:hypothetical protein